MPGWRYAIYSLWAIGFVCAQTPPEKEQVAPELGVLLTEITVTASRTSEAVKTAPQSIRILTGETIERMQARTPNQMLREEPGIWSVQVAAQGSPIIRGQIGNRVLYLWNGLRINNGAIFGGPNGFFNQIPVGSVERMEVIQGPGAVQFGSDAIGGVINILTRPAQDFSQGWQTGGTAEVRYGSVDLEKTGLATVWAANSRFSLISSYTGQHVDDYKAPSIGQIKNTGFEGQGGDISVAFKVRTNQVLRLAMIANRRWDVATYTQSKLNPSGVPRIFGPLEDRGIAKMDYEFQNLGSWSRELKLYSYFQYYDALRDQTVETNPAFALTRTATKQRIWGGGAQNAAQWRWLRVVYGSDYRAEILSSFRELYTTQKSNQSVAYTIPNGNVPPGNFNVFDAFVIGSGQIGSRLNVSVGTRFESNRLRSYPRPQDALTPFTVADLTIDKRWNAMTWSTGAVYDFGRGFSMRGNIASGFRAPSFSDTLSTGVPVFASGIASVPSPNVDPERAITYEFGPRFVSRKFTASLTLYTNQLTDLLSSQNYGTINIPGVGVVIARRNSNIASGYVRGIEASWAYQALPSLTVFGHGTYTRGQDTFRNVPLRFIPPTFGLVGARWSNPKQIWWVEANTALADRLRRHAPDDELDAGFSRDPGFGSPSATNPPLRPDFSLPGFAVANLRAGLDFFKDRKQGVQVFANLSNLFNVRYREAYSQQQLLAPGFGVLIGTRFRF